jgi:hypothetical protein
MTISNKIQLRFPINAQTKLFIDISPFWPPCFFFFLFFFFSKEKKIKEVAENNLQVSKKY